MKLAERSSQAGKALRELRTLILNGEFPPNARLPETAIADRIGISRTPLRQAMALLVDEGLLERLETGGCRIASFTMSDIEDAIEIRGVIEGTAARLAAERGISQEHAEEGKRILAALDRSVSAPGVDFDSYIRLNAEFHDLIARMSDSPIMKREVERAIGLPLASPSAFLKGQEVIPDFQASLHLAQQQHKALFAAVENREGTRAEALAREHARLARQNLAFVMESKPKLAGRVPGLALVSNRKVSNR